MDADSSASRTPVFKIEQVSCPPKPKRMQWSKGFDDWLGSLVVKSKGRNWSDIAKAMCQRFPEVKFTSKKCRARWKNCINPDISKLYLNDAEELLLIAYHSSYKNKWSKISKHLPHRHSNILRNSFYGAMRKLIQQIVLDKKVPSEMTSLAFLQSLYISIFIIELLNLPEVPEHKNPLVPLYIYMYVKEKKIDKSMCEKYIMKVRSTLLARCLNRPSLQHLSNYAYDQLTSSFFGKLVGIIKQSVSPKSYISEEFLFDMIERAVVLNTSFKAPPRPLSSSAFTATSFNTAASFPAAATFPSTTTFPAASLPAPLFSAASYSTPPLSATLTSAASSYSSPYMSSQMKNPLCMMLGSQLTSPSQIPSYLPIPFFPLVSQLPLPPSSLMSYGGLQHLNSR